MKHTLKEYLLATRPWSFVVSAMPVMITTAYLFSEGYSVNWWMALWALVGIILFHAAGNTLSDYYDYMRGVDAEDTQGATMLRDGVFTPAEMRQYAHVLLFVACVSGGAMVFFAGYELLIIGLLGAALAAGYSWLKFHALGDVDVLLNFGILPALGTSLMVTGDVVWSSLWVVPMFVPITMAVLHSNNTRDVACDRRAEITTLPMLIGKKASMWLYYIEVLLPVVWIILCVAIERVDYMAAFGILSLKVALRNLRQMHAFKDDEHAIDNLDQMTAQQQLICGLLLTVSLLVAGVIRLL